VITFVIEKANTDWASIFIAALSVVIAVFALWQSSRQYKTSSEMNYATMSIFLLDDIKKHIITIEKAEPLPLKWAVVDLANSLEIACAFHLSHGSNGRVGSFFEETLDSSLELLSETELWLQILKNAICKRDEFTNIKDYIGSRNEFSSLATILVDQRRRVGNLQPWNGR